MRELSLALVVESVLSVHTSRLMVSTEQINLLWKSQLKESICSSGSIGFVAEIEVHTSLEREQQSDGLQTIISSINIVSEKDHPLQWWMSNLKAT